MRPPPPLSHPPAPSLTREHPQQYLSVPVYTIFKNLTIILIAYGEVLWFGGSVTPLTLVSFGLMVRTALSLSLLPMSYSERGASY